MGRAASWPTLPPAPSWRERSLEERASALQNACRAAMQLLERAPDRSRRLTRVDPVPASTRQLLRRLARAHG